jgi:hypothetical protein
MSSSIEIDPNEPDSWTPPDQETVDGIWESTRAFVDNGNSGDDAAQLLFYTSDCRDSLNILPGEPGEGASEPPLPEEHVVLTGLSVAQLRDDGRVEATVTIYDRYLGGTSSFSGIFVKRLEGERWALDSVDLTNMKVPEEDSATGSAPKPPRRVPCLWLWCRR